jgi:hypothetical protein
MSEKQDKEVPTSFASLFGPAAAQINFDNMQQLCNTDNYEIEGVKYTRRLLKPKDLVSIFKLEKDLEKLKDKSGEVDPIKRLDNVKEQAKIYLKIEDGKDFDKEWENTDIVKMEIVIGACLLNSRGFRKV